MRTSLLLSLSMLCCCLVSCEDKEMVAKSASQKKTLEQLRTDLKALRAESPLAEMPEKLAELEKAVTEAENEFERMKLEVTELESDVQNFEKEKEVAREELRKYRATYTLEAEQEP